MDRWTDLQLKLESVPSIWAQSVPDGPQGLLSQTVEDQSIDPLLAGLVREVSRQVKLQMAYPVAVTRTLTKGADSNIYTLSMSVSMPNSISVDALASVLQIPPSRVPHSFVIELAGDQRVQIGQGRQLLGEQSNTVLLSLDDS